MSGPATRRMARLVCSETTLANLLQLPADCRVLAIFQDVANRDFSIVIEGAALQGVPFGRQLPQIRPEIDRDTRTIHWPGLEGNPT